MGLYWGGRIIGDFLRMRSLAGLFSGELIIGISYGMFNVSNS